MKYIVLYALAASLMINREAAGQKSAIKLLPSDHETVKREMVVDTGCHTRRETDYSLLFPERTEACRDTTIQSSYSMTGTEPGSGKATILPFRLIFPNIFMILDLTAYKP